MAWEENSCICLNMQLIAILSRIGVIYTAINRKNISTMLPLCSEYILFEDMVTMFFLFIARLLA